MIDGAKIVVWSSESSTARSASAFARKKRAREWRLAPIAEKNTKRFVRARPAGPARPRRGGPAEPQRGDPVQLLDRGARLVADRGGEVDHGLDAAQGVPEGGRV